MFPKLLTEFLGTFFLCLVIGLNANAGVANLIAIGALLAGIIYAGGHISGAHYNPAVTFAMLISRNISLSLGLVYFVVQLAAAVCAALVFGEVFGVKGDGIGVFTMETWGPAMVAEVLGTFVLVYVIFNVALAKANQGNDHYGLSIALTVVGAGYVLGPYSGAAFNPAVALSQTVSGFYAWSHLWLYVVGALTGAALATGAYYISVKED